MALMNPCKLRAEMWLAFAALCLRSQQDLPLVTDGHMIIYDLNNSPQEGGTAVSSVHEAKKGTSRRRFVKEVTFGGACVTVAGALSILEAAPLLSAQAGREAASPVQTPGIEPSKSKYAKYFVEGSKPGRMPALGQDQNFVFTFSFVKAGTNSRMHDPHTHPHPEILGFFSADPNSPNDLGAEVEMAMGEELERVVMKKSTLLFLPPDTIHCPMIFRNVVKPFIFLATAPVGKLVEKSYAYLLPEDQRQKPKSKTP